MKALVVNADDFGWSAGINRGVVEAHERGIVTSASLMVRRPAAEEAAGYAREHALLSVGLHVEVGEDTDVARQLATFRALVGRGPTHLDSHHHAHLEEPLRSELIAMGCALSVPVRHFTPDVTHSGGFYGSDQVTVEALVGLLESLSDGTTELMCHPAAAVDFESSYGVERLREFETLCDPRARDAIDRLGIELRALATADAATRPPPSSQPGRGLGR
jgi:predicted glycoside hydrolase/deacetylase ChbG (UPF0249 family)